MFYGHRDFFLRSGGGAGEGAGGGGAGDGGAAAAAAAAAAALAAGGNQPPAAPWGDINAEYKIGDKPWYEVAIPEGPSREHVKAKGYKNPAVLADANYQLTRMATDPNRIAIPAPDADVKVWDEFYTKTRGPNITAPDKYDLKFEPTVKVDEGTLAFGKDVAFKLGLNNKQAQQMADMWNVFVAKSNADGITQSASANDKAMGDLQTSLGDQQFNEAKAAGQRVFNALKSNDKLKGLKMTNEDFDAVEKHIGAAALTKLLAGVGMLSGEAPFVTGAQGGGATGPEAMSQDQAGEEIKRLNGDAEFQKKFTGKDHPQHQEAIDLMSRLYARAGNKAPV